MADDNQNGKAARPASGLTTEQVLALYESDPHFSSLLGPARTDAIARLKEVQLKEYRARTGSMLARG